MRDSINTNSKNAKYKADFEGKIYFKRSKGMDGFIDVEWTTNQQWQIGRQVIPCFQVNQAKIYMRYQLEYGIGEKKQIREEIGEHGCKTMY